MQLWILTWITVLAIVQRGDCLQCYICENCDDISCMETNYCGPIITTEQTTDTTTWNTIDVTTVPPEISSTVSMVRYACFKADVKVNEKTIKKRGCAEFLVNQNACHDMESDIVFETSNCEICTEDGCNGSSTLRQPLITLLGIILLRYVLFQN